MSNRFGFSSYGEVTPPLRPKTEQREQINQAVADYLSRGGEIKNCTIGVASAPDIDVLVKHGDGQHYFDWHSRSNAQNESTIDTRVVREEGKR